MYNKLLVSTGGGIISREQQAEQNDCATIAIGLGGTGVSCLRALKKEVYNRLKPDIADSVVPEYKHIKFLAIDTDVSSLSDNGSIDAIDRNTEFLDLSCADISALLAGTTTLKNKASLQWLKAQSTQNDGSGIEIQSANAGAGGVRQIGRLLLFQNSTNFVNKLTNLITEARRDLGREAEINIQIFTGIGGGTGAGTFLDVCYLVQHVLGSMGLYGAAHTCGYFFLPDVNLDKIATAEVREYVKSNGFAAMKELDYCMKFAINGGEWEQIYDGFTIKTKEQPVKLAHLITATNQDGVIRDDGYNYAMHVVVDYVMEFLTKPFVSENIDNDFTMQSHISNVRNLMSMVRKEHGACYEYCVLGASNAYLPYKDITTYLTAKIFEGFERLDHQLPSDNDIDLFVQNNGLKYEDLLKDLNSGAVSVPFYDVDAGTLYEQTTGISADVIPAVLTTMKDSLAKIKGKITENKAAMLDAYVGKIDSGKSVASVIARIDGSLKSISSQPDKGPYYSGAMLHNINANDLQNKIFGYIKQNETNLSGARANMPLRDQSIETTLRALQNSGKLGRKKAAQAYVNAVRNYFTECAKVDLYSEMDTLLNALNKQIGDLYSKFYGIYETVMMNLEETFRYNLTTLAQPVVEDNGYAVRLMTIADLQESLDEAVHAMRTDKLIAGFTKYMLEHPEEWIAQDEGKIAHMVSKYFLGELHEFTGKTIMDYLKVKFDTEDSTTLSNKIFNEIMNPLANMAAPMFWVDNAKYDIATAGPTGFCAVPEASAEITAAAKNYNVAHNEIIVRPSYNTDRISFLIFKCGIPMFGYKGVDNYRSARRVVGAHIYEGATGKDNRDWRKLYDITPLSAREDVSEELQKKVELCDRAKNLNVIVDEEAGTEKVYYINIYNESDLEEIQNMIEEAQKAAPQAALSFMETIKGKEISVKQRRNVKNVGSDTNQDLAIIDVLVASDELMQLVESQIQLLEKKEKALKQLQEYIDKGTLKNKMVQIFAGALCAGVVEKTNNFAFAYNKETFGVLTPVELTNINTQPYGKYLPLYSAYLGFMELTDDIVVEIEQKVNDRMVNEDCSTSWNKAKELISQEKRNEMAARAQQDYPAEFENFMGFLQKLIYEIEHFQ